MNVPPVAKQPAAHTSWYERLQLTQLDGCRLLSQPAGCHHGQKVQGRICCSCGLNACNVLTAARLACPCAPHCTHCALHVPISFSALIFWCLLVKSAVGPIACWSPPCSTAACSCSEADEPLGLQLCGKPDLGAAAPQPQHPAAAVPLHPALTHYTLHLQKRRSAHCVGLTAWRVIMACTVNCPVIGA